MCFHHQGLAKLGVSDTHTDNLHVWDADIESLHQVGVPDKAHIGDKECAKVALLARQVPYTIDLYNGNSHLKS